LAVTAAKPAGALAPPAATWKSSSAISVLRAISKAAPSAMSLVAGPRPTMRSACAPRICSGSRRRYSPARRQMTPPSCLMAAMAFWIGNEPSA
jgi:hypothetical protein